MRSGDVVGVAALSGVVDPVALASGLVELERLGFEPRLASNLGSRHGPMAGFDAERLAAFHELAADPAVKAIVFARGGYGVTRVVHGIDWELLARHPRAYVGYSDLTPFLGLVVDRLGLVSFHGPMVGPDLGRGLEDDEAASLIGALSGRPVPVPVDSWVAEGEAEGRLAGGCLSLLAGSIGTPWMPKTEGRLLFVEDVEEAPFRLDRMLTHLRRSGNLAGITGLVFGHLGDGVAALGEPWHRETLASLDVPVAFGVRSGHGRPNLTLPLGLPTRLGPAGLEFRATD